MVQESGCGVSPDDLDKWRAIPRLLMLVYMWLLWYVTSWFMALPDPSGPQAALVSTAWGAGAAWFGIYVNGKRNGPAD